MAAEDALQVGFFGDDLRPVAEQLFGVEERDHDAARQLLHRARPITRLRRDDDGSVDGPLGELGTFGGRNLAREGGARVVAEDDHGVARPDAGAAERGVGREHGVGERGQLPQVGAVGP